MNGLRALLLAFALLCLPVAGLPGSAQAETSSAGWEIVSHANPALAPGQTATIKVDPLNVGAASSQGGVEVTDTLPPGVKASNAGELLTPSAGRGAEIGHSLWNCTIAEGVEENSIVSCINDESNLPRLTGGAGHWTPAVSAGEHTAGLGVEPPIGIAVEVALDAPEGILPNRMEITSAGLKAPVSATDPLPISSATPGFGFTRWGGWFSKADGELDTQAGSVPYSASFSFDLARVEEGGELFSAPSANGGEPRNIVVKLPPGFIGNPQAVTQCTRQQFGAGRCPKTSKIGFVSVETGLFPATLPVENLVPPPGEPAQFAFHYESINVFINPSIRTGGDYGITTRIPNAAQKEATGAILTLWGVPADPSHDVWRKGSPSGCIAGEIETGGVCNLGRNRELKPFLRLPTACAGPQPFSIFADSWSDPDATSEAQFFPPGPSGEPAGFDGCNQLPFDPTITSKPTTNVADAPSGLEFDLHIPQPEDVTPIEEEVEGETETTGAEPELHEADLKDAVVTLPKGVSVNPASAGGLAACSSAQFGLTSPIGATPITTTPGPATCPDAAKIGSVEVISPLLSEHDEAGEPTTPHPVKGGVYVAAPLDNPFGSLLAIYLAINDEATGTVLKLAGEVKADPVTGQLTTTFADNPQLPFEDFHLNFFGGAHAALRTPQTCGAFETTTEMTPWSTPEGADALPTDSFEITQSPSGGACPTQASQLPNAPNFEAGTLQPKAGAYSPFVLHLARADGSQELKAIDSTLPEGLIGKLAGVGECSDAQIAAAAARTDLGQGREEIASPSCPLDSEVGTVNVGAGAGPDPYYVQGHAYLAGPYKGAPLSLEIITPAVAGPYDLGVVAVRTALYVDPETARIHAVSDELPHILQGIPLDVRVINLSMNRPNFTLNPTSCAEKTILGTATSVLGNLAPLSQRFQVGECSTLGFKPKLSVRLKGGTRRTAKPALTATLTYPKGAYANIASAQVTLPHSAFLEQGHIRTVCTRVQFAAGAGNGAGCPAGSVYGFARAETPLLDQPLEGPVYLRSSDHPLPDLVAALSGQIDVVLDGEIDSGKGGGIRTTFGAVPDAPVSKFVLSMQGGKKGLIVNSENLCGPKAKTKAIANFTAQNGKVSDTTPTVQNGCKKSKGKKKHNGHRHRGAHK